MLQKLLDGPFGVDRLPEIYGFPGALLTLTLLTYPYVLLTVRAALRRMDRSLEESSRGLGRNSWSTFFQVTLPQLRPSIAAGGLLVGLYTLSDFGAVSLLRYETFTWAIFIQYESALDRTLGAAMSLVLAALALSIVATEALTRGRSRYYTSGPGAARPTPPVRLGRWRWPSLIFCASIVAVSLAFPISVLAYWLFRGVSAGEPLLILWGLLSTRCTSRAWPPGLRLWRPCLWPPFPSATPVSSALSWNERPTSASLYPESPLPSHWCSLGSTTRRRYIRPR